MDQLSLPYRIGLAAIVVLALAWFTVLKPKSDDGGGGSTPTPAAAQAPVATTKAPSSPTAPGVKGLTTAIDKAKGAATTSDAANAKVQAATGGTTTTAATTTAAAPAATTAAAAPAATTTAAAAKPAAAPTDASSAILGQVAKGKVAVVLFSSKQGADDAAVRDALHKLNLHHGRVVIHSASIDDVGKYGAITKGVQIVQAPTLLVIGKGDKARTIVGFTVRSEVQQLVDDVGSL